MVNFLPRIITRVGGSRNFLSHPLNHGFHKVGGVSIRMPAMTFIAGILLDQRRWSRRSKTDRRAMIFIACIETNGASEQQHLGKLSS